MALTRVESVPVFATAALRCAVREMVRCGHFGLTQMRLLLTQHPFAIAEHASSRC